MRIIHKDQTEKIKNSDTCIAIEYPLGDKDINGAVIELKGKYPQSGRVVNLECKELAYIISGSGRIVIEGKEIEVKQGDLILIEPKEKYFWEGDLIMFISCAPAWSSEQHRLVE